MSYADSPRLGLVLKRGMDIGGALVGLVFFLPILLSIALLVRLKHGSPILFRQQRPGLHGKPFMLYKFRTMTDARDARDNLLPDANRLTTFGCFLRRTSLDELPELFNVLRGEMSLVGPRPLLMRYLPYYTERERKRFEVKPGITGLAQISGRNRLLWDKRLELDVQYVEQRSLLLDLKILLQTVSKVLRRADVIDIPGLAQKPLDQYRQESQAPNAEIISSNS